MNYKFISTLLCSLTISISSSPQEKLSEKYNALDEKINRMENNSICE
ncbi:YdcH family protein [Candidatus Cytomitobacter indipagum]|nr:YdcH family protein [Candidatus Cytomitobacter indipagum]